MKTALAAAIASLAAMFLRRHFRHRRIGDPRLASQGAVGGAILILMASTMVALARPSPYPPATQFIGDRYASQAMVSDVVKAVRIKRGKRERAHGRPAAWCGWWLGQHLGMPFRELWLARNWAKVGSSAGGPRIGAIVVWRHHVGIITGHNAMGWIVKSGNDGGAVRERVRSLAGAIAFRDPSS